MAQQWAVLSFDGEYLPFARTVVADRSLPKLSTAVGEEGYLLIADSSFETVSAVLRQRIPAIRGVGADLVDRQDK